MIGRLLAAAVVTTLALGYSAFARDDSNLLQRIRASTADIQRYVDLLKSRTRATRLAALSEMSKSADPAIADLAIETGLASKDPAMRAFAVRAGFRQVRSIIAKVKVPRAPNSQALEVLKLCGEAVSYTIEGYNSRTGHFEVRGQDQTGVGNVSGTTVSLTIDYGCSLTGILQRDGMFSGMVSAPYRKGALPAKFAFR